MGDKFAGCEILEMGIQIEKNGKDLFEEFSKKTKDPKIEEVFCILAEDSKRHAELLHDLFGDVCKYDPEAIYPEEYFSYMNYLATSYGFLNKDEVVKNSGRVKKDSEAIKIGVQFVKESILFYEGMKNLVEEKDIGMVDRLIAEEKRHLGCLCDLKNMVAAEEDPLG